MKKSSTGKRGTELSGITLDRSCPMTLADQLVERLKAAIVRNRCRSGEVLPGIREIAEAAQVSEKVVRAGMRTAQCPFRRADAVRQGRVRRHGAAAHSRRRRAHGAHAHGHRSR
ncbi:MAG: GntR family transcriptional regulator [Kiritimatiellae bacterium]|nr:GntR family transcriptional regulator [Kiritimatiellia bacterium]